MQLDLIILGGGQLAMMLAQSTKELGITLGVACESESEPAAKIVEKQNLFLGSLKDPSFIQLLSSKSRYLSFENEFLDSNLLEQNLSHPKAKVFPSLKALSLVQDKLEQKNLCKKLNIPTSPWCALPSSHTLVEDQALDHWFDQLGLYFGSRCVLKWARGGYDGKGVLVIKDSKDSSEREKAKFFCKEALSKGSRVYAESFISFKKELAMVGIRSHQGDIVTYPAVVSIQENSICKYIQGPAHLFGVPSVSVSKMTAILNSFLTDLNYVGCLAVEFFMDHDFSIFVNEMAPRVHNSGHYSIDACSTSQFENHIRAVTNLSLKKPLSKNYFGMVNLIGSKYSENTSSPAVKAQGLNLHWYSKAPVKKGRKMGHINISSDVEKEFFELFETAKELDSEWMLSL